MVLWVGDISYMKYLPPKASYKIALAGDYYFIVSIQFEICSWSNPPHKKGIFLILWSRGLHRGFNTTIPVLL